jgi:hypothetical protein
MDDGGRSDDIDRLFARLATGPVPDSLIAQAMAQAPLRRARQRRRQVVLALGGDVALLGVITLLAFAFGRNLVAGGADRIVALAVLEPAAVGGAPRDFLFAFLESIPWPLLAALLLAFIALAWTIRFVAALLAPRSARDQTLEGVHA